MRMFTYDLSGAKGIYSQVHLLENQTGVRGHEESPTIQVSTVIHYKTEAFAVQQMPEYCLRLTDSLDLEQLACIDTNRRAVTAESLQALVDGYLRTDDVFSSSFLKRILLLSDETCISSAVLALFAAWGCSTVFHIPSHPKVTAGPYFFSKCGLFWAWKLYPDIQEAFVLSTIPSQSDRNRYHHLNAAAYGASSLCVAVPSRLYFSQSPDFPLAGLRIGVKDLFHLNGVHTGCGNRAYRRLYPAQNITSPAVQVAIDTGAIIIGKTKSAEFGGSQEVIGDWVDYSYPFNVRADGYLACSGSSTGSASALTAYPWLDIALGTDAGGSIRDPAVVHGIYGFKPSHDGTSEPHSVIPCAIFQRSGFLGRSSSSMLHFGQHWLKNTSEVKKLRPKRILLPTEYHSDREDVQKSAEAVVSTLSVWLGAEAVLVSIEETWKVSKPSEVRGLFYDVFRNTFIDVLASEYYEHAASFRADYLRVYGTLPYVSRATQGLWRTGSSTSPERKQAAIEEVKMHNRWFLDHFLQGNDAIMIVPRYNLSHRDDHLGPPEARDYSGFDSNLHASLAGLPNIILPSMPDEMVGQCSFYSNVTHKQELFPVSLSITAPKGTDLGLLKLVDDFVTECNLPKEVSTGKSPFQNVVP